MLTASIIPKPYAGCNRVFRPSPAPAQAADVVSSNIVGYQKLELAKDTYALSGIQFVSVGGSNASLNDLFTSEVPFGTQIMFKGDSGYEYFNYLEEAYDEENDDFVQGWADGDEYLVTDPSVNGTGFWVIAPAATEFVQSGQVDSAATVTVSVEAGAYTMVCNPFPQGFNPNKVSWGADIAYGTQIMVKGESGYIYYNYLEEAYDEAEDDFVPGWADGDEYLVKSDIVGVGEGVWLVAPSATSFTISNPTK